MSEKRRDKRGRILHNGEIQMSDGRYRYKYADSYGEVRYVYSWRLDKNDTMPTGKVWLNRNQLSELFERDIKTIGKHINNALKEELSGQDTVVAKFATTASDGKKYMENGALNLDVGQIVF